MKKVTHLDYGGEPVCDFESKRKRKTKPDLAANEEGVNCKKCLDIIGKSETPRRSYWD